MERDYFDVVRQMGINAGKAAKRGDYQEIVKAAKHILAIDETKHSWEEIAQRYGIDPGTMSPETVDIDGEPFLTKRNAATYLGVTSKTIERHTASGLLQKIKDGSKNLYPQRDLDKIRELRSS